MKDSSRAVSERLSKGFIVQSVVITRRVHCFKYFFSQFGASPFVADIALVVITELGAFNFII